MRLHQREDSHYAQTLSKISRANFLKSNFEFWGSSLELMKMRYVTLGLFPKSEIAGYLAISSWWGHTFSFFFKIESRPFLFSTDDMNKMWRECSHYYFQSFVISRLLSEFTSFWLRSNRWSLLSIFMYAFMSTHADAVICKWIVIHILSRYCNDFALGLKG